MRFDIVKTVFLKELRETLRDRRSMVIMFGIPLLLYPLLMLGTAGLGASKVQRMTEQVGRVAVVNPGGAPHLIGRIRARDSSLRLVPVTDPEAALAADRIDAILIVPRNGERDALAARPVEIHVQLDRSRTASSFTERKIDRLLDDYKGWIIDQRLRARGVPVSLAEPPKTVTEDVSTSDRRLGSILAVLLPNMLLIIGMLGAFYPAVNATTAERELGTLETLLVTPTRKMELLLGKAGLVLISGLLTAGLNLLSMSLAVWRSFSMDRTIGGALTINPGALALTYLAAVPAIIFLAAATLCLALMARNYKEANASVSWVMMVALVPMMVSITEPKTTPGLLVMPLVNTTLVIRDALAGQATAGAFLLAFASSCLYAGLMLSVAARLFSTEDLVNPAWEPLSLKGLRRGPRLRTRRLPAVDEALALYSISLLLLFYVAPAWMHRGLFFQLLATELLFLAVPALLFAWLGRYRWEETFAWRRPAAPWMGGAALMAAGSVPWIVALAGLLNRYWPQSPEVIRQMERLFRAPLAEHPVLTIIAVGVLAGVCEEIFFRGPIQTALTRRLPDWFALTAGAFLFAAAHLDPHGMLPRFLLGLVLGWLVLRSGSLFPAMLAHGLYDASALALQVWGPRPSPFDLTAGPPGETITGPWLVLLAAGAVLAILGWTLCLAAARHRGAKTRAAS
jgi:sodium transport system permease protein